VVSYGGQATAEEDEFSAGAAVTSERIIALAVLLVLCKRAGNPAEHADIEAWLDGRSETEGGFLWLAARLSVRPSTLKHSVRAMLTASRREHTTLLQRIEAAQKRYGD
jgi:hypothetical protein